MIPKELLKEASKAIKANNFVLASELFSRVLNRFPNHSAAKAGLKKLSKRTSNGTSNVTQSDLDGVVNTLQTGAFQKAIELAQSLVLKDPSLTILYNIIGISFTSLQKPEEAVNYFKTALRLNKNYSEARGNLGTALLLIGKTEESIRHLEQSLKENPKNPLALNSLGNAKRSKNLINEAESSFREALTIAPDYLSALTSYGTLLSEEGEYKKSIKMFENALKISPKDTDIFKNYLDALSGDNQAKKAITLIKDTSEEVSQSPPFQLLIAELQNALGNLAEGVNLLTQLVKREPNYFQGYRALSVVYKFKKSDDLIIKMKDIFAKKTLNESGKIHLGFALGKALHDIGEYDNAFSAYTQANISRRKELTYDSDEFNRMVLAFKNDFNPKLINSVAKFGNKNTKPIFILGMNRSGTTLVEQILSSHSKVAGGGEISFLNRYCFRRFHNSESWVDFNPTDFTERYLEQLNLIDKNIAHVTDKMPLNFLWIGLIKAAFPAAKIIHLTRNPMDTCLSNYRTYFSSTGNGHAYDQVELANFYHQYRDLMCHWYSLFPNEIFRCDYELLIANQAEVSKLLIDYCNLAWEPQVLDFHKNKRTIKTASVHQVRNKIYSSSVSGWKKYEKHLQPMYKIFDQNGCFEPWNVQSFN